MAPSFEDERNKPSSKADAQQRKANPPYLQRSWPLPETRFSSIAAPRCTLRNVPVRFLIRTNPLTTSVPRAYAPELDDTMIRSLCVARTFGEPSSASNRNRCCTWQASSHEQRLPSWPSDRTVLPFKIDTSYRHSKRSD
jgi:hypothetical protein